MEFVYWPMKGKAETIRLVLAYFQLKHTEKNPTSFEEALTLTRNNGYDFPNMPCLTDEDVKLTESSAIPIYLAHKAGDKNFFGKEGLERVKHQMLLGVFDDFLNIVFELLKTGDFDATYESKRPTLERKLQELSQFKGEKKFFFEHVTYSDIAFFFLAEFFKEIAKGLKKPSPFADLPNLENHLENVASLPGIRDYLENDPRAKRPIILPHVSKFPFANN